MKKRFSCLLLALLLTALLAACGNTQTPSSSSDGSPLQTSAAVEPMHPTGQLRAYGAEGSYGAHWSNFLTTRQGFYEISDENIVTLTNYITRQYGILCSEEGCTHNNESCPAILPSPSGRYSLLEAAGKLVLVNRGYQEYTYSEEGPYNGATYLPAIIYTMDYDLKNRTPLCTLGDQEVLEGGWITDDEYLYGIRTRYPEDITAEDMEYIKTRTIIKINLATGEISDLCELDPREEFFVGVLGNEILTRCIEYPTDNSTLMGEENHDAWDKNMQQSRMAHYTINPATGARTRLPKDYRNIGFGGSVLDGEYFYYNCVEDFTWNQGIDSIGPTPQPIYKVHLPTGETTIIYDGAESHDVNTGYIWDGKLFISVTDYSNYDRRSGEGELREYYYWQDLATGERAEPGLYYTTPSEMSPDGERTNLIIPMADAGEYFLVITGSRRVNENSWVSDRALILKEDYWANKENYIPITNLA